MPNTVKENPPRLLSSEEVMDLLGIKRVMLWKLTTETDPEKRLPSKKLGKLRKYFQADVLAFIEKLPS